MESIPSRKYASHIILDSSICEPFRYLKDERCDTLMEDHANIDSKFIVDESIAKYMHRVVGFFHIKGLDHDVTLSSRLS